MPLIKSNSALVAFDSKNYLSDDFIFLNLIQSISINVKHNRINSKHIGKQNTLINQFVESDVDLNINFLHNKSFLNETFFGLVRATSLSGNEFFLDKIISSNFFNDNALILFNDIKNGDLIFSSLNSETYSISVGNLYLNSYSFSYKINQVPVVSASFSSGNLKVSKLTNDLKFQSWNNSLVQINNSIFESFDLVNKNLNDLIFVMDGVTASSSFNSASYSPLLSLSNLSDGILQSLDLSINLNRDKLYFFKNANNVSERKLILPIIGNLKVSGISYNLNLGDLENFFNSGSFFDITINILDEQKTVVGNIIYKDLYVESFSHSININGFLEYSLDCSFQIIKNSGMKVVGTGKSILAENIKTLDGDDIRTSDAFFVQSRSI